MPSSKLTRPGLRLESEQSLLLDSRQLMHKSAEKVSPLKQSQRKSVVSHESKVGQELPQFMMKCPVQTFEVTTAYRKRRRECQRQKRSQQTRQIGGGANTNSEGLSDFYQSSAIAAP